MFDFTGVPVDDWHKVALLTIIFIQYRWHVEVMRRLKKGM